MIIAPAFVCEKKNIDEIFEKLRTGIKNYHEEIVMRIGVPKEIKPQENRIGLTPESVQVFTFQMVIKF